jgi:hypothetical protein
VVKNVDALELRVVVASVIAVIADSVLVPQDLPKHGAHLVTALARLHGGNHVGEKGGEERKNVGNSVAQFGTGNRKYRWRARVQPKRESGVVLPLQPLVLWAPCKARWVWAYRPYVLERLM